MANLMQIHRARQICREHGVRMVRFKGAIHFYFPSGRHASVWYPMEGRVNNVEEKDLDDMLEEIQKGGR